VGESTPSGFSFPGMKPPCLLPLREKGLGDEGKGVLARLLQAFAERIAWAEGGRGWGQMNPREAIESLRLRSKSSILGMKGGKLAICI
jgi:hypothetical protein